MSLRTKVVVAFAAIAGLVAALMGILSYQATDNEVWGQLDRSLAATAGQLAAGARLRWRCPSARRTSRTRTVIAAAPLTRSSPSSSRLTARSTRSPEVPAPCRSRTLTGTSRV
ncbi:hypothetical protein [Fodinicola feengrottensis]|uniref:hypothetical protein n=1 Tax=Fodinicola feengrottensis TaxID=435914 RepID=UPI002443077B|nr:hypothetical protein [Fodinicola feengrottensis]